MNYRTLFGPVLSRRLGISLGVELVPAKVCSFDCLYCECGKTNRLTLDRKEYVKANIILEELKHFLFQDKKVAIDVITITGAGEPVLNSCLEQVIDGIRELTSIPIVILTNSSFIWDKEVRRILSLADILLPSLDAVLEDSFQKINNPHQDIKLKNIIQGLKDYRKEYADKKIWLEILFLDGINDREQDLKELEKIIQYIQPDRIDVSTLSRPGAYSGYNPINDEKLDMIVKRLGNSNRCSQKNNLSNSNLINITDALKRRPMTYEELQQLSNLSSEKLKTFLSEQISNGVLEKRILEGKTYYSSK